MRPAGPANPSFILHNGQPTTRPTLRGARGSIVPLGEPDFRIRASRPYRARTKGEVERPIGYVRESRSGRSAPGF